MPEKEAKARTKINRLLEEAGWRFFDDEKGKANIVLENNIKITEGKLNGFGEDFEAVKKGFIDFLLLDEKGFPFIVLEAKAEDKNPLFGKEQARKYAKSQNCRFVILSNGNLHYLWDLERGNPNAIGALPAPESIEGYASFKPNPQQLIDELVERDYIVLTQKPDYKTDPAYINIATQRHFIEINKLRFLRPCQVRAIETVQRSVKEGNDRFLFEMATGTGKTLVAAAINTLNEEFSLLSSVAVMRGKPEMLDNCYLVFFLNSMQGRQSMLSMISGVAITRLTLTKLNSALIPLPPLSIQHSIVAKIEAERKIIDGCKELIAIYEAKIKKVIDKVWEE